MTSMTVNNIQLMASLLKVMTTHTDTVFSAVNGFHGFLEILLNGRYENK